MWLAMCPLSNRADITRSQSQAANCPGYANLRDMAATPVGPVDSSIRPPRTSPALLVLFWSVIRFGTLGSFLIDCRTIEPLVSLKPQPRVGRVILILERPESTSAALRFRHPC